MNKIILALFALCALIASSLAASTTGTYTAKYDNVDIQKILHNDRLLEGYFKCLMEESRCTPDGQELKKALPDALSNKCERCTEKQKKGSETIIRFLIDNKPEMWKKLEDKYDPKGTYRTTYKAEAKEYGITV